ncbi:hypothetical protein DdX_11768 [Ditylenchus destructor]|uniref:DUF4773 domain-containing protein n=1 Tax=Ditylenchus destructor TaxID=166010 RepID=A0AAD4R4D1_9BILA|nr:hypothetical protein DdX_11768 [Ditylenchus destructor]
MLSFTFVVVSITVFLVNLQAGTALSSGSTEEVNNAPRSDLGCHCNTGSCECHIDFDVVGQHVSVSAKVSIVMPNRLVKLTICALDDICAYAIVNEDQKPVCLEAFRRHAAKLCVAVKDLAITSTEVSTHLEFTGKILDFDIGPIDTPTIHIPIPQYGSQLDVSARNDFGLKRNVNKGK